MAYKKHLLDDRFPKSIKNATSTSDGLMSSEDKARLDSIFEFGLLTPATEYKDGIMVKEDKKKLDNIEENANNYIHPDNPETRHVTDDQIQGWNNQVKYTNSTPMPTTVGGLEKGSTFDNLDYSVLLTRLLYPYIDPTISNVVITPATTILEKGNIFTLSRIQFKITTPSLPGTESLTYNFKNNNVVFNTIQSTNRTINASVVLSINSNSSISVEVIDSVNNKTKVFSLITYKFINPFYYGVINTSDTISQALIKAKTKLLQEKGTKTLKFTTNNQKMLFSYPKEYGSLRTIYDANNFNVINTFTRTEVSVTSNDGTVVPYYVYINDASTVSNYNMQFVF